MAYGHKLNVEEIFFALAETKFSEASEVSGDVKTYNPEKQEPEIFTGYPTEEGIAAVTVALVSWAISLESFTNAVWNSSFAPKIPEGKVRRMAVRTLSTDEKLKELFRLFSYELSSAGWWPTIGRLIEIRGRFVHYKEDFQNQGFEFADPVRSEFHEAEVAKIRSDVIACINELGRLADIPTEFTKGEYQFETISY